MIVVFGAILDFPRPGAEVLWSSIIILDGAFYGVNEAGHRRFGCSTMHQDD